jgi:peroxin-14
MLDRVKDQERISYGELQQELKSLKALLLSSRDNNASSGAPAILAQLGRKPTIPAWQLAQSPSTATSSTPLATNQTGVSSTDSSSSQEIEEQPTP